MYDSNVKSSNCDYPFAVNLDRCVGSCNTFNDLSDGVCVPNKREYLNLLRFNVITETSGSKTLTKHVHPNINVELMEENVVQIKNGITINVHASVKIQKIIVCAKKIIFGIVLHLVVKMVNIHQVLLRIQ